jgi:acyl carrier protein
MQPRSPSPDVVDDPAQSAEAGSEVVDVGLEREVAKLIVEALNLEIAPEAIDPQDPLFGDGLGLDSIDILEVALVVSKNYGFQLRSDDDDNVRIFQSLRSLSQHIGRHRVK